MGSPHLEALLEVLVLLQEHGIVNDDLGGSNAQIQNTVIYSLGRLQGQGQVRALPGTELATPLLSHDALGPGSSPERCQGFPPSRQAWTTPLMICTHGSVQALSHQNTQPGGRAVLLPSEKHTRGKSWESGYRLGHTPEYSSLQNPGGAYPQQPQGLVIILMPELQLTALTPHTCQVIHLLEAHLGGLLQDDAGLMRQSEVSG